MNPRVHYTKPSITDLEVEYATDAARNGWGDRCYEYISRFEDAFKTHLGVKYAIATSSCTGALHMGLYALGIRTDDEVILADINWIATCAPIVHLGAKPVFVDILPDTWCIGPEQAEGAITPKTKAIIATHIYGNLCDMDALLDIGERYSIPIIEDAAEAIGSIWNGKRAGSMGTFGTFSFHGTKTMTTGEGGMFVTNDRKLYEHVLTLSNHGRARGQRRQFWPDMIGFKYKMSNIQAAIGCAQLERIDELIAGKRRVFKYYEQNLKHLPIRMNPEPQGTINGYWMPTIVVEEKISFDRDKLLRLFKEQNIDGRVFFWPLSTLDIFNNTSKNLNSIDIAFRGVNLPSYNGMYEKEMDKIISVIERKMK